MGYILSMAGTLALWGGFLALTAYEGARGVRLFASSRSRLDGFVERISFIIAHVDFAAWMKDESRRMVVRVGHDIAHLSLQVVRAVERLLTRAVKHIRATSAADAAPRETERPFIGTLADFKAKLSATRPEISDIEKVGEK